MVAALLVRAPCFGETDLEAPSVIAVLDAGAADRAVGERDFQHKTSDIGLKRTMPLSGRTARIMSGLQPEVKRGVIEATTHDEDFLGVWMGLAAESGGIRPGEKASHSCVLTRLVIDTQRQFLGHAFQTMDRCPPFPVLWA